MEAEALFNEIDEDQSGELSLLELQDHLADLGFADVDAEQLLFDLDTDKNSQVRIAGEKKALRGLCGRYAELSSWLAMTDISND